MSQRHDEYCPKHVNTASKLNWQSKNVEDFEEDFSPENSGSLDGLEENFPREDTQVMHTESNSVEPLMVEPEMETLPMLLDIRVNNMSNEEALVDTGNTCHITVNEKLVHKLNLPTTALKKPRRIQGVSQGMDEIITNLTWAAIDIGGYRVRKAFMYVIPKQHHSIILGLKWMRKHSVKVDFKDNIITFGERGIKVQPINKAERNDSLSMNGAVEMEKNGRSSVKVLAASTDDIEKTLSAKKPVNPREFLPEYLLPLTEAFEPKNAVTLPPHRPGIDHQIPLEVDDNGREKEVPWGPLYSMSRDELLVLRKTLTELLDKGWIRQSKSSCGAPVLFARKPGGGLRFCVDYRGLNAVTRKDRYPIPLIKETLEVVGRSKWLTKLDVSSAFHRIRIDKGEEWKTAMRTRYGTYEWLVTPFGLSGGPATFQRYINSVLRPYLDEFCTAYIDDILIFTNGSLEDHRNKVKLVLRKLMAAGLTIDVRKCAFEATSVTYLGYIIEVGKGLRMDPAKIKAILDWKPPATVKGVRGFLGFANYYRMFIPDYSKTAHPLTQLTKKGIRFEWTTECDSAFNKLKDLFVRDPILAAFNPDAPTKIEPDASKWAVGGVLLQCQNRDYVNQDDVAAEWRPVAYFSRKNAPAECNYDIHDKELLAIIRCIDEWDSELRSLAAPFKIVTDHKNLETFTRVRSKPLNERQIRWQEKLSRHRFRIQYRPGSQQVLADALSRRDQDIPQDSNDERIDSFGRVLIPPDLVVCPIEDTTNVESKKLFNNQELQELWQRASEKDEGYHQVVESVRRGDRKLPSTVKHVQMSECEIDSDDLLRFRDRIWVPESEPLRTKLIQEAHDSPLTGHPGRDETYRILARHWFWPNLSNDVKQFVRNCDICGNATVWRDKKQGLLKPLPIPDRIWTDITIDFITGLPLSNGCTTIQVITDRLSKTKSYESVQDGKLTAEESAWRFIDRHVRYHGFPRSIVSDRGVQWVNIFWKRVCELVGIQRCLSTAYHPETDGATERENQELERYIRCFISYSQENWTELLPVAELAANNRKSASIGMSPFFLTHGYEVDPIEAGEEIKINDNSTSPKTKAEAMVKKLREAQQIAEAAMASAQQAQENIANRYRTPAPKYKIGDKVRLNLRHIRTDRPCKKFDWIHGKYTVIGIVGSHSIRLNVPKGIHNVFHTWLIRPVPNDPLPSQSITDYQPPCIIGDSNEEEWGVEAILDVRIHNRGKRARKEALVKWTGYQTPTWEPMENVEDTAAMERYEKRSD